MKLHEWVDQYNEGSAGSSFEEPSKLYANIDNIRYKAHFYNNNASFYKWETFVATDKYNGWHEMNFAILEFFTIEWEQDNE